MEANNMTSIIRSLPLYPRNGSAYVRRRAGVDYSPVGDWPKLRPGQELEVQDTSGWRWGVVVKQVEDENSALVEVLSDKVALPLPTIVDGVLALPNLSGHAHLRVWERGDIVYLDDVYYKVRKVQIDRYGSKRIYTLETSTPEAYVKRPGRKSYSSEVSARLAVGTATQTSTGEWLHITKLSRTAFSGALGRDYTYSGKGKYVTAERAARINEKAPHNIDRVLSGLTGERVSGPMPEGVVQLIPKDLSSLAATGTTVAVEGSKVYHKRVGDPDQVDSWYHYIVVVTPPKEILKIVRAFVRKETHRCQKPLLL